jgi:hypothetical protein
VVVSAGRESDVPTVQTSQARLNSKFFLEVRPTTIGWLMADAQRASDVATNV